MILLYGIISRREQKVFGQPAVETAGVYGISYQDLSILASPCQHDFSNQVPKEQLLKTFVVYQQVLEKVLQTQSVIPFKFGTTFHGEAEVISLLKSKYDFFQKLLSIYAEVAEFCLTASWLDCKSVLKGLLLQDPELLLLRQKAETSQDATDTIKVGERLQQLLRVKSNEISTDLLGKLHETVMDSICHEKPNDSMILNASFLVSKAKEHAFYGMVEEFNHIDGEKVQFRIVGPLPIYSFATLFVHQFTSKELKKARQLLGIAKANNFSDVQSAYHHLVTLLHPDRDSTHVQKFSEVRSAYQLLSKCYQETKTCSWDDDFVEIEVKKAEP